METNHTAVRQKLVADGWIENIECNKNRDKLAAEDGGLRGIIVSTSNSSPVKFRSTISPLLKLIVYSRLLCSRGSFGTFLLISSGPRPEGNEEAVMRNNYWILLLIWSTRSINWTFSILSTHFCCESTVQLKRVSLLTENSFHTKSTLVQTVRNVAVISSADPDAIAPRSYRMHREKDANLFYRKKQYQHKELTKKHLFLNLL